MKPVLTKEDFVRRYQANEFGNRSPTWNTIHEFLPGCHRGPFHLRNRVAGGATFYNLDYNTTCIKWTSPNIGRQSNWYVSAMAPTSSTLIQGEVQRLVGGLYLRYTRVAKPMRDALAAKQYHVWNTAALYLLRRFMCQRSYDWFQYLLEEYPDHVIEFSTYGVDWGTVPGVNTVWWEIRKY